MIITIDGPAGSGKSAAALLLAQRLQIRHLDTGAMYRAVALDALERGLTGDPVAMAQRAAEIGLEFDFSTCPAGVLLDGRNVSLAIRKPEVTAITWMAADNTGVRRELVARQQRIAQESVSLVTEGRDQGTIAFPKADFKFYLDADPGSRAHRRWLELSRKGVAIQESEVLAQIIQRDRQDQTREVGPLVQATDAIAIDTTAMSLSQVVDRMANTIALSTSLETRA